MIITSCLAARTLYLERKVRQLEGSKENMENIKALNDSDSPSSTDKEGTVRVAESAMDIAFKSLVLSSIACSLLVLIGVLLACHLLGWVG